jgi:N-methylhydantoinase A
VIVPEVGAALSAAGALMSDLMTEFATAFLASSAAFDVTAANAMLEDLEARCQAFIRRTGAAADSLIEFIIEARYPHQVWSLEVPLATHRFASSIDVDRMVSDFHAQHDEIYGIHDVRSAIEIVVLRARVRCRLRTDPPGRLKALDSRARAVTTRRVYFRDSGALDAHVLRLENMPVEAAVCGPAIIESSFTTVVVDPGAIVTRRASGSLVVNPRIRRESTGPASLLATRRGDVVEDLK